MGVAAVINWGYSFNLEGICIKLRLFGLYSHVLVSFFCCMTNPRTEIGPKFLKHSMNHSGYSCMSRVIRCFWLLKPYSVCLTLVFPPQNLTRFQTPLSQKPKSLRNLLGLPFRFCLLFCLSVLPRQSFSRSDRSNDIRGGVSARGHMVIP